MIAHSGTITAFIAVYLVSIAVFNFLGVTIAGKLSAVTRTINDALRTSIVWSIQLGVYYFFPVGTGHNYGSPWGSHSWMQLLGFVCLVLGSLLNHAVLKLPCLDYEEASAREVP